MELKEATHLDCLGFGVDSSVGFYWLSVIIKWKIFLRSTRLQSFFLRSTENSTLVHQATCRADLRTANLKMVTQTDNKNLVITHT